MVKSIVTVTFFSIINLVFSFGSQLVVAILFGASAQTDAYFIAITLPILFVNILGTISITAIVPNFIELRIKSGEASAWRLASYITALLLLVLLLYAIASILFSKNIVQFMAPGLTANQLVLANELFVWSTPIILLMSFSQIAISLHHVDEKFTLPAMSLVLPTLGSVLGALALNSKIGIHSLLIGQMFGALLQAVILAWYLVRPDRLWLRFNESVTGLGGVANMSLPLAFGGMLYLSIPIIERFFASNLQIGTISHLSMSSRLGNLIPPLLASGLAATLLPRIAKQIANSNLEGALKTFSLTLRLFVIISIPIVLFSPLYALPLTRLLFERGAFTFEDSKAVAGFLPIYLVALTAGAFGSLIGNCFYSLFKDTLTLSINSFIHMGVYIITAAFLTQLFGPTGLAAAYAIFWISSVGVATLLLRRRINQQGGYTLMVTILRSITAAILTYSILKIFLQDIESIWIQIVFVMIGFCLYVALCWKIFRETIFNLILNR